MNFALWTADSDVALPSGIYVLISLAKYCPPQVLMTAYYGFIYPTLPTVWYCGVPVQTNKSLVEKTSKILVVDSADSLLFEITLFCMSKCAMTTGQDIHSYETRDRGNYWTGKHRTVVYEHLPSQAVVVNDESKHSTFSRINIVICFIPCGRPTVICFIPCGSRAADSLDGHRNVTGLYTFS
ncbi:hypothetical protein J6590_060699 [Homalodisca vitripennis]|nr:hypothetical protein J6590_060699 [Homalodisca vitripennis]